MKLHLPSKLNLALPLCGRVLSRDGELSFRDQRSMRTIVNSTQAKNIHERDLCRHCLRAIGVLPALVRKPRKPEGELSDQELYDELTEESES